MKRFIRLKEAHLYQINHKNKKRYEYHFMVERIGLKKSDDTEKQKRFTLYSDALKYAEEQAEKEKCPLADTTKIQWSTAHAGKISRKISSKPKPKE